jgi:erythromycin esterase-like protein
MILRPGRDGLSRHAGFLSGALALTVALTLLTACSQSAPPRNAAEARNDEPALASVRAAGQPLTGTPYDYDALMDMIGDSRFVLLGDQTHGTHEFYRERARITRRLIEEKGFTAVAIEGDWTDAARVQQFLQGRGRDQTAEQALAAYKSFPAWMWNNSDMRDLVAWMRQHNETNRAAGRAGFYGLDLYGLWPSMQQTVTTLDRLDPAAARRARQRYRCFEGFRKDPQLYGRTTAAQPNRSCQRQATEEFAELDAWLQAGTVPPAQREELFSAAQNARVVKNGEAYYRAVQHGESGNHLSWNLRDRHMADTLDTLARFLGEGGRPAKIVVWAHNTHLGDARETQMHKAGELNLGQLMRQRHPDDAVLVGFSTYQGTVIAADAWGDRGQTKRLRPALPGSSARLFHETGLGDFYLPLRGTAPARPLAQPLPERAVGVIYKPLAERRNHYFEARLAPQFDAIIHLDKTEAVRPLAR